jgi:hypothetical protein
MLNKDCYTFKLLNKKNGFIDNFVDATYIITMEKNGRKENIDQQLSVYTPTNKIYIVYNKGYKNCKKILPKQVTNYDLIDAYMNIFDHSLKENYNNILILEDDFIFDPKIKNKLILNQIKNFFYNFNKLKIPVTFNLGPIPVLIYSPYFENINKNKDIYRCNFCGTSHAIIYNKKIQKKILEYYKNNNNNIEIRHWDWFLTGKYKMYFYKNPLAYQLLNETENQKNWGFDPSQHNTLRYKIDRYFTKKYLSIFKLDSNPIYGFNLHFKVSYIIHIIIYILLLLFIIYLMCYIL